MNELIRSLEKYPAWVNWKEINGKKVPFNPNTGEYASSTDSLTWGTIDRVAIETPFKGFVLSANDPYTCIDIDHCFENISLHERVLNERALCIVLFFQSYTEISPSKDGVHIWMFGRVPAAIKRSDFEVYSDKRYITVTEDPIFNYEVEDRQAKLDKMYAKYGGDSRDLSIDDIESQECQEELREMYRVSPYLRDIWNFNLGFVKAEGTPDYSSYDMSLAGLLREWSVEKVVWAINFFREQHGVSLKHKKAVIMTVQKARL